MYTRLETICVCKNKIKKNHTCIYKICLLFIMCKM